MARKKTKSKSKRKKRLLKPTQRNLVALLKKYKRIKLEVKRPREENSVLQRILTVNGSSIMRERIYRHDSAYNPSGYFYSVYSPSYKTVIKWSRYRRSCFCSDLKQYMMFCKAKASGKLDQHDERFDWHTDSKRAYAYKTPAARIVAAMMFHDEDDELIITSVYVGRGFKKRVA